MSKVKVAIIGCGGIANQKHFPALKNNSDFLMVKNCYMNFDLSGK